MSDYQLVNDQSSKRISLVYITRSLVNVFCFFPALKQFPVNRYPVSNFGLIKNVHLSFITSPGIYT